MQVTILHNASDKRPHLALLPKQGATGPPRPPASDPSPPMAEASTKPDHHLAAKGQLITPNTDRAAAKIESVYETCTRPHAKT